MSLNLALTMSWSLQACLEGAPLTESADWVLPWRQGKSGLQSTYPVTQTHALILPLPVRPLTL